MKKSFLRTAALVFTISMSGFADLTLEYSDASRALVYRVGNRVFFEKCKDNAPPPVRGCSGQPQAQVFSADHDNYVRSVQSFYGVVDRLYGGIPTGVALDSKLKNLRVHLTNNDLRQDELKKAEETLLATEQMRERVTLADKEILNAIEKEKKLILSEDFQKERMRVVNLSFFSVMYLPDVKKIYKLSEPVMFDKHKTACAEFGKDWSPIGKAENFSKSLRKRLAESATISESANSKIWTEGASGGRYKVTCAYPNGFNTNVRYYTPFEYHDKVKSASLRGTSVCAFTANSHMQTVEYLPSESTVVELGKVDLDLKYLTEPVESSENSVISTTHPVLCTTDFKFDPYQLDLTTEDGLVHFNLDALEKNLDRLAKKLYSYKGNYVRGISSILPQFKVDPSVAAGFSYRSLLSRYFALEMLAAVIETTETPFVKEKVLENLKLGLTNSKKQLEIAGIQDIELSSGIYQVAFSAVKLSLQNSTQFILDENLRKDAEKMMTDLGLLEAAFKTEGYKKSQAKELLGILQSSPKLIEHLSSESRTSGFGATLEKVKVYLKEKA